VGFSHEDDISSLGCEQGYPLAHDRKNIERALYKDVFTYYMTESKRKKRGAELGVFDSYEK
jgi:hypothetical protein